MPRKYYLMGVFAFLIFLLSIITASFSWKCTSDGCIGVIFLGGIAAVTYLVQVFVLIPLCTIVWRDIREKSKHAALHWIVVSTAALLIPMLFLKGGINAWVGF